MEGVYENLFESGVYNYVEKYNKTAGNTKWLYFYSFETDGKSTYQPSGGMNVNKFKKISFEFNTIEPPIDTKVLSNTFVI